MNIEVFLEPLTTRPAPKGAVSIATCSWGWGPSHDRIEEYLLQRHRSRRAWTLWLRPIEPDIGGCFARALLESPVALASEAAAKLLLAASWKIEWETFETPGLGFTVHHAGLLTVGEIESMGVSVFVKPGAADS